MWNKGVYNTIRMLKSTRMLEITNRIASIHNYNHIIDNIYLGNILGARDEGFLRRENIGATVNCTVDEEFHPYFLNKPTFRFDVEDSRDPENLEKFRNLLPSAIEFIEREANRGNAVYIHCYWGLMRSATLTAAYLIKKYQYTPEEAIHYVRSKRPKSLSALYNYNDILQEFHQEHCLI